RTFGLFGARRNRGWGTPCRFIAGHVRTGDNNLTSMRSDKCSSESRLGCYLGKIRKAEKVVVWCRVLVRAEVLALLALYELHLGANVSNAGIIGICFIF